MFLKSPFPDWSTLTRIAEDGSEEPAAAATAKKEEAANKANSARRVSLKVSMALANVEFCMLMEAYLKKESSDRSQPLSCSTSMADV